MLNCVSFALDMIARGYPVFALKDNDPKKQPPEGRSWLPYRSRNRKLAESRLQNTRTYAVATGSGLLVVDVDVKEGRPGQDTFDELNVLYGFPETFTVQTGSGGKHLYYKIPPYLELSGKANQLGPSVDVRCHNNYVVGPGSFVEGREYTVLNDAPAAECPAWILELCEKALEREANYAVPLCDWDLPQNVARAIRFLKDEAKPAIQYQGGNATLYHVAAQVRDYAISEPTGLDLILDHYNERCSPPWPPEQARVVVSNAYSYAKRRPGTKLAGTVEFGDATQEFPDDFLEPKKKGLFWEPFEAGAAKGAEPLGLPLVEDVLLRNSMVVLYGPPSSGKTFVALDMAFAIATGRPWHEHDTTPGLVVYVSAEGGRGIYKRLAALQKKHGVTDCPLAIVPCPINLLNSKADINALLRIIKEAEDHYGLPCCLVVIDTLSRAISGGDENASTDMGAFVTNVDKIREKAKCAALVVHHTGKDHFKGARGHSLLRAATDTEIEVAEHRIKVTKQRDIEAIKTKRFKLDIIQIGRDERKKKDITSSTVRFLAHNDFGIELTPTEQEVFDCFEHIARAQARAKGDADDWENETVGRKDWELHAVTKVGISKSTFMRSVRTIDQSGHLDTVRKGREVQYVMRKQVTDD